MIKLDTVIQAVPERRAFIEKQIEVIPEARILEDTDHLGSWWSLKTILNRSIEEGYSHTLVVQDDTWPCRDLVKAIECACAEVETTPFTIFHPSYSGRKDSKVNRRLLAAFGKQKFEKVEWYPGVANVYPLSLIPEFYEWITVAELDMAFWGHVADPIHFNFKEDYRWWKYMKHKRIPLLCSCPCLVEHLGSKDSTIESSFKGSIRMATQYIGAQASALDDWWNLDIPLGVDL